MGFHSFEVPGDDELRSAIIAKIHTLSHMGQKIPKSYDDVRKLLMRKQEEIQKHAGAFHFNVIETFLFV